MTLLLALLTPAHAQETVTVYGKGSVPVKKPEIALSIPPYELNSSLFTFPTGLRILMQSDRTHPVVAMHMVVDHGSSDDTEGKDGLAHFVEHTWFKSQHTFVEPVTGKETALPAMMDVIRDLGAFGTFGATTDADTTQYHTVASSEFADLLMQAESWRLAEPYAQVDPAEIAIEAEVILNEWRRRNDQGHNLVWDYAASAVFPEGHAYARSSTKASLESIRMDDLSSFFDAHYRPSETTLVVVGDFAPEEAEGLIFANFDWKLLDPDLDRSVDLWRAPKPGVSDPDPGRRADWIVGAYDPTDRTGERVRYTRHVLDAEGAPVVAEPRIDQSPDEREPPPVGSREIVVRSAPIEEDEVYAVWSLPGGFRSDDDALTMVGNVAQGTVGKLLRGVDEVDFAGCGVQPREENTMLFCGARFDPEKTSPENALDKVVNQISTIWNPDQQLSLGRIFARERNRSLRNILHAIDPIASSGGRAKDLATALHFTGDARAHSTMMQRTRAVDVKHVTELAKTHLKRNRFATLHLTPIPEEDRDTNAVGSSFAGAGAKALEATEPIFPSVVADAWVKPQLEGLSVVELPNGLRVVALQHGDVPLVSASVVLGGGTDLAPHNTFDLYRRFRSSEGHSTLPIAGRYLRNWWGQAERLQIRASSGNLDASLWMLRRRLQTMQPDTEHLQDWVKSRKRSVQKDWNKAAWQVAFAGRAHLYPDHPLGRPTTLADMDAYKAQGAPVIKSLIDARYHPHNTTLVLVGNLPVETMQEEAFNAFSSWKGEEVPPLPTVPGPAMPTENPVVWLVDDPGVTQSRVTGSCRLAAGPGDREGVQVLSDLVGSEVFDTLRVREGLAYSPSGRASFASNGSAALSIDALATNAGVGRVVQYIQDWTANEGGFSEAKVESFKLRFARRDGLKAQSVAQMTGVLTTALRRGQTWEEVVQKGERIASVDAAQLSRILKPCAGHLVVTVMGPQEVLGPLLEKGGVAYEVFDWKAARNAMYEAEDPKALKKLLKKK